MAYYTGAACYSTRVEMKPRNLGHSWAAVSSAEEGRRALGQTSQVRWVLRVYTVALGHYAPGMSVRVSSASLNGYKCPVLPLAQLLGLQVRRVTAGSALRPSRLRAPDLAGPPLTRLVLVDVAPICVDI